MMKCYVRQSFTLWNVMYPIVEWQACLFFLWSCPENRSQHSLYGWCSTNFYPHLSMFPPTFHQCKVNYKRLRNEWIKSDLTLPNGLCCIGRGGWREQSTKQVLKSVKLKPHMRLITAHSLTAQTT